MATINEKNSKDGKPKTSKMKNFLFFLTTLTTSVYGQAPNVNASQSSFLTVGKFDGKLPETYLSIFRNQNCWVFPSKKQIYWKKIGSTSLKKIPGFLKEITSADCDFFSTRCIFGGQGGAEVYDITSTKATFKGYFWTSNHSTFYGDPTKLILVNSVQNIQSTDYFLTAESTNTGIMRWKLPTNTSYSFLKISLDEDKITGINFLLHIPRTTLFMNSFNAVPELAISDFTTMNLLGKWRKTITFNSNFHLAYYDKDPTKTQIFASRYSVVQIHNYAERKYLKQISVKSPTSQIIVIPESEFFFAYTGYEAVLYNTSSIYTSDFLWETVESSTSIYWDDFSGKLLISNSSGNLDGFQLKYEKVTKPDTPPPSWYNVDENHFCHPNCLECDFLFGRAVCKSDKCKTGEATYIDFVGSPPTTDETGIEIYLPFATNKELFESGFRNAKGCYLLTNNKNPPSNKFLPGTTFSFTSTLTELKVNDTEPVVEPAPSNQTIYTKNTTIPIPADQEDPEGKNHFLELLIVLIIFLVVAGLLLYLICFICVESKGDFEKRRKLNMWKLKGWIRSMKLKMGKRKKSKDSFVVERKKKMEQSMDELMIEEERVNKKIKGLNELDEDQFKFREIPGTNLKRRSTTASHNRSKTPNMKKRQFTLGDGEDEDSFTFENLQLKKHKSSKEKRGNFQPGEKDEEIEHKLSKPRTRPKARSFNRRRGPFGSQGMMQDREYPQIPMKVEKRRRDDSDDSGEENEKRRKGKRRRKKNETREERKERRRRARIERRKRLKGKLKKGLAG